MSLFDYSPDERHELAQLTGELDQTVQHLRNDLVHGRSTLAPVERDSLVKVLAALNSYLDESASRDETTPEIAARIPPAWVIRLDEARRTTESSAVDRLPEVVERVKNRTEQHEDLDTIADVVGIAVRGSRGAVADSFTEY